MHSVFVAIGPILLILFFGFVAYSNHRRRARFRDGGRPMTPPQPGPSPGPGAPQPSLNSPAPQPPAPSRPGLFRMITPSRPTRILFGVGAALVVAGFLVVITVANHFHSQPIPVLLLVVVIALVASGGFIVGGLVLAAFLRQSKATRSGWPPR